MTILILFIVKNSPQRFITVIEDKILVNSISFKFQFFI